MSTNCCTNPSSPTTVPSNAPIVAACSNRRRNTIRFQNTGTAILYFVRKLDCCPAVPSPTNYEFLLLPATILDASGSVILTDSDAQFNVVADPVGIGQLAIFETINC